MTRRRDSGHINHHKRQFRRKHADERVRFWAGLVAGGQGSDVLGTDAFGDQYRIGRVHGHQFDFVRAEPQFIVMRRGVRKESGIVRHQTDGSALFFKRGFDGQAGTTDVAGRYVTAVYADTEGQLAFAGKFAGVAISDVTRQAWPIGGLKFGDYPTGFLDAAEVLDIKLVGRNDRSFVRKRTQV